MNDYKHYYNYAKLLAQKWKHSKRKIYEKLQYRGVDPIMIDHIIRSLEKDKIIDDRKAFELDVFILEEKRYGYRRIKESLISKGYAKSLIETYIYNKDIEIDNCNFYYLKGIKKYKNHRYSDEEREKLINFLKRYGFNDKIIREVVKAGIKYENVM